jgi:hypothetical protein
MLLVTVWPRGDVLMVEFDGLIQTLARLFTGDCKYMKEEIDHDLLP